MTALGAGGLLEVGPKNVLRDLTRIDFADVDAWSCGTVQSIRVVSAALADADQRRPAADLESFLLAGLRLAVGTPDHGALSDEAFASEVRAPYSWMTEKLDAVRAGLVPDPGEALDAAVAEVGRLLCGKGFTAHQSQDAITRAMAGTETES